MGVELSEPTPGSANSRIEASRPAHPEGGEIHLAFMLRSEKGPQEALGRSERPERPSHLPGRLRARRGAAPIEYVRVIDQRT
jgi:hypothetical protein